MHPEVDHGVDSWLNAARAGAPEDPFGEFIYLWIAFNQLYNYHCYDLHSRCNLDHQLAADLMSRQSGSSPGTSMLSCTSNRNITEWGRVACVVRFLPEQVSANILHRQEVDFFLTREVYDPNAQTRLPAHGGVLDIHKTKTKSPGRPLYTLGFVNAVTQYRANPSDPSIAIQNLAYLLYIIRCNLVHGNKSYDSEKNWEVVGYAVPLLREIVISLREKDMGRQSPSRNALP